MPFIAASALCIIAQRAHAAAADSFPVAAPRVDGVADDSDRTRTCAGPASEAGRAVPEEF
jgi:hypothetical protein